jgi:hypothetical protein
VGHLGSDGQLGQVGHLSFRGVLKVLREAFPSDIAVFRLFCYAGFLCVGLVVCGFFPKSCQSVSVMSTP